MNKTQTSNKKELVSKWYVIDAKGKKLGRLSTHIANVLRGKQKPVFSPNLDTGDFVIVINASQVIVTGKKSFKKLYCRHSGRPGGMKSETFKHLQARLPGRVIEKSVKGMLPKNVLGRQIFKKLKVYAEYNHPHAAQRPSVIDV